MAPEFLGVEVYILDKIDTVFDKIRKLTSKKLKICKARVARISAVRHGKLLGGLKNMHKLRKFASQTLTSIPRALVLPYVAFQGSMCMCS